MANTANMKSIKDNGVDRNILDISELAFDF